ncbi:MAG TPA: glutamate-1-semialdehyde-2,1-aminomutase [Candidatus Melainabacteria bacterium]|jgi:glutamate-1-semialdehyde 2,1-aminomutase|nr:glutamate-1-semialdehyde-2,1-aminomutase [Candidatus Melainabacteria bacterium]HIN64020.1 glutamate-1-semialdehyde-2,1-aminomutase [Candidatus Obscuribacterales bacterium]
MSTPSVISRSKQLAARAEAVIPGGVNSPARALKAVGADPIYFDRGDGPYLFDVDGNRFLDYVGSWGPMILGHCHPRVLEAIEVTLAHGTSFGAPCRQEVEMAELVCQLIPSIEMVRMVNSGTEATMSAIRVARAFTKRDIIVKFEGCYHGHGDAFLAKAGSGLATLGISSCPGVPEEATKLTITIPFNDLDAVKKVFKEHSKEIAAVILEPVVGNAGLILPQDGFLKGLRDITEKEGALLIFDEVMTGFRVALGGAQARYEIKPDLTTLGKIIGGGLPVGAYGGRKDIMQMIAPSGSVYQAGTLSGNPLAMAAGLAQLKMLQQPETYVKLNNKTELLAKGLSEIAEKKGGMRVAHITGMITLFFTDKEVIDFETAKKSDTEKFAKVWRKLAEKGIYWPPSQFEAAFVSTVHSTKDIEETLKAFEESV